MNGKIILLLFILFYHKEVKSKKSTLRNDDLFSSEDLLLFVDEPDHHREKRALEDLDAGSGSPEPTLTSLIPSTLSPTITGTTTFISNATSSDTSTGPSLTSTITSTVSLSSTLESSPTTSSSTTTSTSSSIEPTTTLIITDSTVTRPPASLVSTTPPTTSSSSTRASSQSSSLSSPPTVSTSTPISTSTPPSTPSFTTPLTTTTTTEASTTSTTTSTTSAPESPTPTTTTTTQNTRIITSSTTTTTTSDSTSRILRGPNDVSLVYYWRSNLNLRRSMPIFIDDIELNLFGNNYNYFRIHPNGLISFPRTMSNLILNAPFGSIAGFTTPIIAPFWTSSVLTRNSDILYGAYNLKTLPTSLSQQISLLMRNSSSQRDVSVNEFVSEIVYIITWRNVQITNSPADTATYQIILTTSLTQQTSYAIFNYQSVQVNALPAGQNVFIGYTDGNSNYFTNSYSLNADAAGDPRQIATQYGNTNTAGVWVYNMKYEETDSCTIWFKSAFVSPDRESIFPRNNSFVPCSSDLTGARINPFFSLYTSPTWHENSVCYKLISPVRNFLQQFCCYDVSTGALQTSGPNAGFFYNSDNFGDIINHGFLCCFNNTWSQCSKFYRIHPPSIATNDGSGFVSGSGGGDPHIITYDRVDYPFNGFGKFVMSRALDSTFEIQINTELFRNVNGSSLTGTFIKSVAVRTIDSPIIQIDLVDYFALNPYFVAYLDQNIESLENFTRNFNFRHDLPCRTDPGRRCTAIIHNKEGVKIVFNNGLSLQLKISKIDLNKFESRSWMMINIVLPKTYQNSLEGLMGNYNGLDSDDIKSRSGHIIADRSNDESIYNALVTWRVSAENGDEDLFVSGSHSAKFSKVAKFAIRSTHDFKPVFFKSLVVDSITRVQCNHSRQCIYDTVVTGLLAVGLNSINESSEFQKTLQILDNEPPLIAFREETIRIDWSMEGTSVAITADVADPHGLQIRVHVENASDYMTETHTLNSTNSIVQINYRIKRGELPLFKIIASDSRSRTSVAYASGILICDCRSADSDNQCVYEQIMTVVNPLVSLVACSCNEFFYGEFCQHERDECSTSNPCNLAPGINMKCVTLSLAEQKKLGRGYTCHGHCPPGFTRNDYNACVDIDECESASTCPADAKCVNTLGGFRCNCGEGRTFVNNRCQDVNLCQTEFNHCDSICASNKTTVTCSCYPGYELDSIDRRKCRKISTYPGCDRLGCSHICTEENNRPVCKCFKGYQLDKDAKSCQNINECLVNNGGCPENCTDLPGSHRCDCDVGSYYNISTNTCHVCPSLKYGLDCSQTCIMGINSLRCDPILGPVCNPGFTGADCSVLINSCQDHVLPKNMICKTRPNSLEITCSPGFTFNYLTNECDLIDHCGTNPCPSTAKCVSELSGFSCKCPAGFYYDQSKRICEDVNECVDESVCPENSFCSNTDGSYECVCDNWFINTNTGDSKNPRCQDIDECSLNISRCMSKTEQCLNLPGSYTCECLPGYVYSHVRVACVPLRDLLSTSSIPAEYPVPPVLNSGLAKSSQPNDQTGIIIIVLIPVIILLVLAVLAAFICYCWFRIRISRDESKFSRSQQSSSIRFPIQSNSDQANRRMTAPAPSRPTHLPIGTVNPAYNLIDIDSIHPDIPDTTNHRTIYRTSYTPNFHPAIRYSDQFSPSTHVDEFFRSLEENARSHQRKTIARPSSSANFLGSHTNTRSDSTFSLPIAYYENTSPYCDYRIKSVVDRSHSDHDLGLDDDDDAGRDDSLENDDMHEIIEAFTPSVKIPRPKIHQNPLRIFKFSNKSDDINT